MQPKLPPKRDERRGIPMPDSLSLWESRLKAQDIVALTFFAFVVILLLLMPFSKRIWSLLQQPAKSLLIVAAFGILIVLTLIALRWG